MTSDSESDLSEAADPPNDTLSSSPSNDLENGAQGQYDSTDPGVSYDEDAIGSDDAAYDIELLPPAQIQPSAVERSSSQASSTLGKRKASMDDEEFMLNNPELYGLRRSGRARPSRRIVESDSEGSASDIQSGPRKRRKRIGSAQASKQPTPSVASQTDSDSDGGIYQKSRPRSSNTKKHQRRLLQSSFARAPTHAEVRFSTRKAAKVSNYNEEDGDDFDDEDDMQYKYVTEPDLNIPLVDVILNHRLRKDTSKEASDLDKQDFEYYVKWQGKSHCHASWEPYGSLQNSKGIRKAENYFKRVVQEDIRIQKTPDIPLEEKEKWYLDREKDADALEQHSKVERVIAQREDEHGNIQYYVKWKGLYYDSSTWEDADLIQQIAQHEIDRFELRSASIPASGKPKDSFKHLEEQPSYIKHGKLREFQIKGINFLAFNWMRDRNVILADEMGLGKTVQTVSFLNWLRHDRCQQGPFIVVVPLSTMPSWAETFDNWTPDMNYVVYNGGEAARTIIRENELFVDGTKRPKFHVLLTTYEYILAESSFLSGIRWQFLAVDEAHRLKNRESQLYIKLAEFKAPHRLLITGTPMQNTLGELSALMDFLNPGVVQIEDNIDFQSDEASRKLAAMTTTLNGYMIRRTKNNVENDLPKKKEQTLRVMLSEVQVEHYTNILTRNYAALNEGAKGPKQSLLNIMMELKKASNHPFMFPNVEERIMAGVTRREEVLQKIILSSGKMTLLDHLLTKARKEGARVLIFSQMVKMLDIIGQYLSLKNYQFQRLDGTVDSSSRRQAIDHFNSPDSTDFCFLLSTRAGGLGINLMTANQVILFDSDWNPQADLQAMARAHRIGQTRDVNVYRLVTRDTVEEEVLERAKNKMILEYLTIQRGVTDKDAKDLHERMSRAGKSVEAPSGSDDISQILKKRSQKMFAGQSGNQKKLEELDIDDVLANAEEHNTEQPEGIAADGGEEFLKSFEFTDVQLELLDWDQMIPKEKLDEINAQEEEKANQKYLDDQIMQNAPRKRKKDDGDRDERAAKKRAREIVSDAADDSDERVARDPKRPLSDKDVRGLIRGYLRYGAIEDCGEELVREARLGGRDINLLKSTLKELIDKATELKDENEKRIQEEEQAQGKIIPKKALKAVTFDFKGTTRNNAYTISDRAEDMRLLKQAVKQSSDFKNFRIPEAQKGANSFTCKWEAREDGMLCVGIVRHGYGAWQQIRDDPDLGLADKLFLEEHRVEKKQKRTQGEQQGTKSPGAVHLVRRVDYLLSVLRDKMSGSQNPAAKRAVENHHRNNKKNGMHARGDSRAVASASPAPSSGPKRQREVHKNRPRSGTERRVSNGEANGDRPRAPSRPHQNGDARHHHGTSNGYDPIYMGLLFKDVKNNLNALKWATKANIREKQKRADMLRAELMVVGDHVTSLINFEELPENQKVLMERRFWDHVTEFWPNHGTEADKIRDMYQRIASSRAAPPDEAADGADEMAAQADGQVNGAKAESNHSTLKREPSINGVKVEPH